MFLDVIIPTYNRHRMLCRVLESLFIAELPPGLEVRITVVDNNSNDGTRETVESYARKFSGRLHYVFEGRQGRSFALNAGIESTSGDLIAMIDDDEEVDRQWFSSINSIFGGGEVDFAGGPYVPRWSIQPPAWLPSTYLGAIGWVDGGKQVVPFGADYPGILMGGNAVITRAILNRVGLYNTNLGRTGERLLAGEDDDMYQRLLAVGARGYYFPGLIIYHHIPRERLTKSYFRRWCFWRGVSSGLIDRDRRMPVPYFCGIPRYVFGQAARGLASTVSGTLRGRRSGSSQIFESELAVWDAAGFFFGKHFYRATSYASAKPILDVPAPIASFIEGDTKTRVVE